MASALNCETAPSPRVREAECPVCGVEVLLVAIAGKPVRLDRREVLCPPIKCYHRAEGSHDDCLYCFGTGELGQEPPLRAVAVGESGRARWWRHGGTRRVGEGLHHPHVCSGEEIAS